MPTGMMRSIGNAMADERSHFSVNDKRITSLAFARGYDASSAESSRVPGFVRTSEPWDPAVAMGRYRIGWPAGSYL
jgi:hypothetical protein